MTTQTYSPDWLGTLSNFIIHQPTRRLVPDSQTLAADMTDAELWDAMVTNPYATCTYTPDGVIDMASNQSSLQVSSAWTAGIGPGQDGEAEPSVEIDHKTSGGSYAGYAPWTVGTIPVARYVKGRLVMDTSLGVGWISAFSLTAAAQAPGVLESALWTRLSGYAGLIALVNKRIYPVVAPQAAQAPFVTYQRISTTRESAMGSDPGVAHVRMQVDCYGAASPVSDGYADAKAVAAQVRGALQRWSDSTTSPEILDTFVDNEQDIFDPADAERYHRVTLEFMIHHRE